MTIMNKNVMLSGISGQCGSFLADILISKGYIVHGIIRRSSTITTGRVDHLYADPHSGNTKLYLHYGDLADHNSLRTILDKVNPSYVLNLAAQSHVKVSFEIPLYTADIVATGALRMLEAVREHQNATGEEIRYYQASSSEMFGSSPPPQNELTPFHPRSPYGVAKVAAYWYTVNYREAYGMYACNGILFNNESERRGETFVTRKITRAVGRIYHGLQDKLYLGNLEAKRDWCHTLDSMDCVWRMLQQPKPDDYVVASGETHTVAEFAKLAFSKVGLNYLDYVVVDPQYFRPSEVDCLLGDSTKARTILGWKPTISFDNLVDRMVNNDLELARQEKLLKSQ